jgi:RimJ/RimL family protein N-acetyltransferase
VFSIEILYQIDDIKKLVKFEPDEKSEIRWLKLPDDLYAVHLFAKDRDPDIIFDEKESYETFKKWYENGDIYCAVFVNDRIVATAAVEKYSDDKWETGSVRVLQAERNKGYAKQICYFVTKFILDSGYIATCRTEEHNIAMQKVIHALGFTPCTV